MAQAIERLIQHSEFQSLPYEQQVGLMSNVLTKFAPNLAGDPDKLTSASEDLIRKYRPRTAFETYGSFLSGFIPIAGPLVQQYGFGDQVTPPRLLSAMGIVDDDNPYGALIRAGLDIPLMIGGGIIGGMTAREVGKRFFPALLNQTIPALIGRELISGTASGTGELVLDPPTSIAEGAARLGLSAVGQAAFTSAGSFLFGADARTNRSLKATLGAEGLEAYNAKIDGGNFRDITDFEISAVEKALGNRKDERAVNARLGLTEIKLRRSQIISDELAAADMERISTQQRLNQEVEGGRVEQITREQDLAYQEELARKGQAEAYAPIRAEEEFKQALTAEQIKAEPFVAEHARQKEIDSLITKISEGPVERGTERLLQSEDQLITLLNDEKIHGTQGADFPFVSNEPVTLPLVMVQDLGGGTGRVVVVDRLSGTRADLRFIGSVDRRTLKLPQTVEELAATRRVEIEQGINPYPDFPRAREILTSRIAGERLTRLANLEASRFNSDSGTVQREIFRLRKEAAGHYLDAHNSPVSEDIKTKLAKLPSVDNQRVLASLENLNSQDVQAGAKALRSAGFEQVRVSLRPDGTFDITVANKNTPELSRLGGLYSRYITYQGTFDPTTTRTYSGLSPKDHQDLGKAFGVKESSREQFEKIIETTTKELRDRGIRFPVSAEALGIETPEVQVSTGRKQAQKMRSDIIAQTTEDVRRIEPGDIVEYSGQKGPEQMIVMNKTMTPDPVGNNLGTTTYHVAPLRGVDIENLASQNLAVIPLSENQLKQMGAKRSVNFPITPTMQSKFTLESPSRQLGDLFGITRDQMPPAVVQGTERAIRQAGKELDLQIGVSKAGLVRIGKGQVEFSNLTPEEAGLILSRLKQFQQDRAQLSSFFGGCI